jgi:ATP-dependent DNA helicase RecQ
VDEARWEGVDRGLFEALREVRKGLATERGVPAFVIFGDNTLRELAAARPSTPANFRRVRGIGEVKAADFGQHFLQEIADYCHAHQLETDQFGAAAMVTPAKKAKMPSPQRDQAMQMFAEGRSLEEIAAATGRVRGTIGQYLAEWIIKNRPPLADG